MKEIRWKRSITAVMVLIVAVCMLAGCGWNTGSSKDKSKDSGAGEELTTDSIKTFEDVLRLDAEDVQNSVGGGKVVYAFKYNGSYYRAIGDISQEDEDKYIGIDFADEDYEQQQTQIVKDIPVDTVEKLDDQILTQDELDALAGKTGAELTAEGWTYQGSFYLDEMEFYMEYGPFVYTVTFDGSASVKDAEGYAPEKETKDMKVKAARFESFGDGATDLDPEQN